MFCLILHYRLMSAWVTPTEYPISYVKILYNDEIKKGQEITVCDKDLTPYNQYQQSLWDSLTLKMNLFENETVNFDVKRVNDGRSVYESFVALIDSPYILHEDICDAMESWQFVFSCKCIEAINYLNDYRSIENEFDPHLYVSLKDEKEQKRREVELTKWFS